MLTTLFKGLSSVNRCPVDSHSAGFKNKVYNLQGKEGPNEIFLFYGLGTFYLRLYWLNTIQIIIRRKKPPQQHCHSFFLCASSHRHNLCYSSCEAQARTRHSLMSSLRRIEPMVNLTVITTELGPSPSLHAKIEIILMTRGASCLHSKGPW